jgi:hypothetical protein
MIANRKRVTSDRPARLRKVFMVGISSVIELWSVALLGPAGESIVGEKEGRDLSHRGTESTEERRETRLEFAHETHEKARKMEWSGKSRASLCALI